MPRPRSRARAASRPDDASPGGGGFLLPGAVFGVLLVAGAGALWFAKTRAVATDPETLCRLDESPPSVSAILIDVTDQLSLAERTQTLNEVERLRSEIPQYGEVQVFAIDGDPGTSGRPWLQICNPGRGAEMNALYQNPAMAEKRWQGEFKQRLEEVLSSLTAKESSDESPIMESIRSVSLLSLGDPRFDDSERQLFVFSDFMQNSPEQYSQYSNAALEFERFASTPYAESVKSNLAGVRVHMYYIERPSTSMFQNGRHQQFWVKYFDKSGATVASVKRILGD